MSTMGGAHLPGNLSLLLPLEGKVLMYGAVPETKITGPLII